MSKCKQLVKNLWQDESGQGATEYILLLVVVVAIAALFRNKIYSAVQSKLGDLSDSLGKFTGTGQ